jgi:hypothetical protein
VNTFTSHSLAAIAGAVLVASGIFAYNTLTKITEPSIIAQPAKELKNATTSKLSCAPLIIYQDKVKKALNLPAGVVKDPVQKVVGSTQVKASDYPHTVSAVANIELGKVDLYVRRDPTPWLAFDRRLKLGAFYGTNDSENGVFLGLAQYEFAQIKRLHLTVHGQADTSGRYFVGGGFTW